MKKKIILASESPRRKQFLDSLGLQYEVIPSYIDENIPDAIGKSGRMQQIATELARKKVFAVGEKLRKSGNYNGDELIIIGADTVVFYGDRIFGKPNSPAEARETLKLLCGKTHQVCTGIAVLVYDLSVGTMKCLTESETTQVVFRDYNRDEINAYVATGEPFDKAGSYALQGIGSCLIRKIEGCYTNVIGLPMPKLIKMLREVDIPVLGL